MAVERKRSSSKNTIIYVHCVLAMEKGRRKKLCGKYSTKGKFSVKREGIFARRNNK
jgi:hypothetical protein